MEPFNLPEDLNALSSEDLQGLIESGQEEFSALYDSDDLSNETLERMQVIADSIEAVVNEQNSRKRAELSAQVEAANEGDEPVAAEATDGEDDEDDEEEEEEGKVEAAGETEVPEPAPVDPQPAPSGPEQPEPAPAPEEEDDSSDHAAPESDEPVTASVKATPKEKVVKTNPQIAVPERPSVVIAAAVDVPQFYVGQRLDPVTLADAIHNKARMLGDSRGAQTVYPVATVERPFHPEYDLDGLDNAGQWDAIAAGAAPSALTAAGGWCAPSEIVYDLFEVECTSETLFQLPQFRVTRGGVRFPVFTPYDEDLDPGFVWTEQDDIDAVTGTGTKPCVRIPCPTFTEVRLDATGLCVTAGNLIDRAYPEQVRWFLNRAMRAYERNNALRKLTAVLADVASATVTDTIAATGAIVDALLLQAASYRQLHGLCQGERLDVIAPSWLADVVKADIAHQQFTFSGQGSLPTDEQVNAWFAAANLNIRYIDNWQNFATQPTLAWPGTVQVLIEYPGSYVEFNGGRLDLGVIRDSTLNATNDFTALWFEEFYAIGRRGPQGRLVTIDIDVNGAVGARVALGA